VIQGTLTLTIFFVHVGRKLQARNASTPRTPAASLSPLRSLLQRGNKSLLMPTKTKHENRLMNELNLHVCSNIIYGCIECTAT